MLRIGVLTGFTIEFTVFVEDAGVTVGSGVLVDGFNFAFLLNLAGFVALTF